MDSGSAASDWAREVRERPRARDVLLVLLAALVLYAPYLGAEEFHYEEARRAVPAREMLSSGDYVLPTIWQHAYLSKPPLIYWTIAGLGTLRGTVDEVTARLPSLLATAATALALLLLGARWFSRRAGLAAALIWLVSPAVFNKGGLAEIEALFALLVLGATAWLPAAVAGSWRSALACGLCLGAALLSKGPPALVFHSAALLALAREARASGRWLRARVLVDPRALAALALGLALVGAWAALLLARLDVGETLTTWRTQLDRSGGPDLLEVLRLRFDFVTALAGGVTAATLVALLVADRATWRSAWQSPAFRQCALLIGLAALALAISAPKHRYAYPLTPWMALAGAALFDLRSRRDAGRAAALPARALAALFGLGGLALGLLPLLRGGRLDAGTQLDGLGWGLALLSALVGAALLLRLRRAGLAELGVGALLVLGCVRSMTLTQYDAQRAERRGYRRVAAELTALVPEGRRLYTHLWVHFNEQAYVPREIVYVGDLAQVPRGEHVLVLDPTPESERGFRRLGASVLDDGKTAVVLFRRRPRPDTTDR